VDGMDVVNKPKGEPVENPDKMTRVESRPT
jgi:hypothetical protein